MTGILETTSPRLSSRRTHGRGVNAVAELLRRHLSVPEIYLEPKISGVPAVDVLAVDKAGSGDFHIAEVKAIGELLPRTELRKMLNRIKQLPFHYKYLALPSYAANLSEPHLRFAEYPELFAESGIGRVGIISFDRRILVASSEIDRSSATAIEKFLNKAKPDMSVRL
jgi:hypothetical protein